MVDDIGESHNLIDSRPDIAKALKTALMTWIDEVGAPAPRVRNSKFHPDGELARQKKRGRRRQQ